MLSPLRIVGIQPRKQKAYLKLAQNLFRENTRRLRKQVNQNLYPSYGHRQTRWMIQEIPKKCQPLSGKRKTPSLSKNFHETET